MIRKLIPGTLALGLIAIVHAQPGAPAAPVAPATPAAAPKPAADPATVKADSSYALGMRTGGTFGQQFGRFGVTSADIEPEAFMKGFLSGLKGGKPTEAETAKLQSAMESLGEMLQAREKTLATNNLEAGKKFLEENGKRKEVTTTKSGLQYEVLAKGGEEKYVAPKDEKSPEKQFSVNYKGTLTDGTEFDASAPGEPALMNLQVIDGFKEALTTMPVGSKWKLFIPSGLAYGEQRGSALIGPNSVLVFELELLKIEDAPAAPEGGGGFPIPIPGQ